MSLKYAKLVNMAIQNEITNSQPYLITYRTNTLSNYLIYLNQII